jgi:hypothetical protein
VIFSRRDLRGAEVGGILLLSEQDKRVYEKLPSLQIQSEKEDIQ